MASPTPTYDFGQAQYDALPASIKAIYTHLEWMWLSTEQKGALVQTETEPEWTE